MSHTGVSVGHTLQPDTWVAVCSHHRFVWEATSVKVGAELGAVTAFSWMDTIMPWSSWQSFCALPREMPRKLPCHTFSDTP